MVGENSGTRENQKRDLRKKANPQSTCPSLFCNFIFVVAVFIPSVGFLTILQRNVCVRERSAFVGNWMGDKWGYTELQR